MMYKRNSPECVTNVFDGLPYLPENDNQVFGAGYRFGGGIGYQFGMVVSTPLCTRTGRVGTRWDCILNWYLPLADTPKDITKRKSHRCNEMDEKPI